MPTYWISDETGQSWKIKAMSAQDAVNLIGEPGKDYSVAYWDTGYIIGHTRNGIYIPCP